MLFRYLTLLALIARDVFADVQFVTPAPGASIASGGKTLLVSWAESGEAPPLASLTTYTLFLCAGGNDAASQIQIPLDGESGVGKFSAGYQVSGIIDVTFGGSVSNAYFLKIISPVTGGTITNYSPRFSLTGMTGIFPPNVLAGIKEVSGTEGPPTEKPNVNQPGPAGATASSASFGIPFASQTGQIFYAPMQKRPGTKITAQTISPAYSTSSVTLATTILPPPVQTTTFTVSLTLSTDSHAHTATPAAQPKDDMQKFLERWRD